MAGNPGAKTSKNVVSLITSKGFHNYIANAYNKATTLRQLQNKKKKKKEPVEEEEEEEEEEEVLKYKKIEKKLWGFIEGAYHGAEVSIQVFEPPKEK